MPQKTLQIVLFLGCNFTTCSAESKLQYDISAQIRYDTCNPTSSVKGFEHIRHFSFSYGLSRLFDRRRNFTAGTLKAFYLCNWI